MRDEKDVLFTFDYELFLGKKSGTVGECLTKPTEQILEILNPYKIKGIFFVDTAYLLRLREISAKNVSAEEDLRLILLQLRRLIKEGHYLFLHLHPHWLDAVYISEAREWKLTDLSKYRFHNLDNQQKNYLFEESINILRGIAFSINPDYKINAYRAGGWSIEPFSDFKPFFEKFNIRYDFTVLPGKAELSTARYFDYTDMNPLSSVYRFQEEVTKVDNKGSFIEFPVSVLRVSRHTDIINRVWLKMVYRIYEAESYGGIGILSKPLPMSSKNNLRNKYYEVAAIESMTVIKLPLYVNLLKKNNYLHIASHPKMIREHNLYTFRRFLKNIYDRYQIETDFYKMI